MTLIQITQNNQIMDIIYDRHEDEWEKCISNEHRSKVASTWMKENTLDRWRHKKVLSAIKPLISKQSTWLTVGDGRYGTDAHYIISNGGTAHASDISDRLLKIGSSSGFIDSFSAENGEKLSFKDESFDYVLIKEAFHHFPRPWIALHEAFRVCKMAVILIEPNDGKRGFLQSISSSLKQAARIILKKGAGNYGFEPVGNFIYKVNQRELEKFLLGMHYRHIATTGSNDYYEQGIEFIDLDTTSFSEKTKILKVKTFIKIQDFLSKSGFAASGSLTAALFKEQPSEEIKASLANSGWKLKELPRNPYL